MIWKHSPIVKKLVRRKGQGRLQAVLNTGADGDSMTCRPCIFMLPPAGISAAPTGNRIVASCGISIHSSFLTIRHTKLFPNWIISGLPV